MNNIYSLLANIFIALGIIAGIIIGIMGYFIITKDPNTLLYYDGFGRELSVSPYFIRFIFGIDRLWPGTQWATFDTLFPLGNIGIGIYFFSLNNK